jgi:uncharacterized protein YndB with AHSA1/START domain
MSEMSFTYVHEAAPELVFTCLTTPEHLTHFWGPRGSHAPAEGIRIDLRPGGRFDAVIISDADGSRHDMHAEYVEVIESELLVWREQLGPGQQMTTTISLRDLGDGRTEVVTRVASFPAAFAAGPARAGFQSSLERFAEYLISLPNEPDVDPGRDYREARGRDR